MTVGTRSAQKAPTRVSKSRDLAERGAMGEIKQLDELGVNRTTGLDSQETQQTGKYAYLQGSCNPQSAIQSRKPARCLRHSGSCNSRSTEEPKTSSAPSRDSISSPHTIGVFLTYQQKDPGSHADTPKYTR